MSYKEKVNASDFRQLRQEMALLRGKLDASNRTIAALRLKQQEAHAKATVERRRHEAEMFKELKLVRKQLEASSKRALRRQLRGMRELQSAVDDLANADVKAEGQQSKKTRIKWLEIEDESVPSVDGDVLGYEEDEQKQVLLEEKRSDPHIVDGTSHVQTTHACFVRRGNWSTIRHPLTYPPWRRHTLRHTISSILSQSSCTGADPAVGIMGLYLGRWSTKSVSGARNPNRKRTRD